MIKDVSHLYVWPTKYWDIAKIWLFGGHLGFFSGLNKIWTKHPIFTKFTFLNLSHLVENNDTKYDLFIIKILKSYYLGDFCLFCHKKGWKMPAQPQFLSDFNIIGTKMLRNLLCNFWAGKCIDTKHVIFFVPM